MTLLSNTIDSHTLTPGDYIRKKRVNLKLFQNQFVDLLNSNSTSLNLSEAVTISRWESGSVVPTFGRFMNILKALEGDNFLSVIDSLYHQGLLDLYMHSFDKSLSKINYFREHPYCGNESLQFSSSPPDKERLKQISQGIGYNGSLSEKILERLLNEKNRKDKLLYQECTSSCDLLGHIIGVKLRNTVVQDLAQTGTIPDNIFDHEQGDETTLCIISFYAGSNDIFARLLGDVIKEHFCDKSIAQFAVISHNESMIRSFSALNFSTAYQPGKADKNINSTTELNKKLLVHKSKDIAKNRLAICTVIRAMNPVSIAT